MLAGMPVGAADGMLVNLADTPANRAFFGTTGTADGSSPFPQLRIVAVTARAGRAMLGAILGQTGTGEQTLLERLGVAVHPPQELPRLLAAEGYAACPADHTFRTGRFIGRPESGLRIQRTIYGRT
jgi:hypothetical protein